MSVCTALPAAAQTLSTEVVVDRTIEPAQRAASRPASLYPRLVLPAVAPAELSTAGYTGFSDVTRTYFPLRPASDAGFPVLSPYRGYASIGYFPTYNLGISAGYRLIDTDRTRLNVWGQFDGESFKASGDAWRQTYNGGQIGADLNQAIGRCSRLTASLSGGYASFKSQFYDSQSLGEGRLAVAWLSSAGPVDYKVGLKGAIDSYGDIAPVPAPDRKEPGINQRLFGFDAAGTYAFSTRSHAGLGVEGTWLTTSQGGPTLGTVGVTPYYDWRTERFTARIGARADFTTGGDSGVGVTPQVTLAWTPSGTFALYGTATGGTQLNPISHLRQYSPYIAGREALGRSEIPADICIGFNVGPFHGLSVEVFGAYAVANDWIMPSEPIFRQLAACDVKGFRGGVRLGYTFRALFKINAYAEFAQSGKDKGWYQWRDRATKVIGAGAEVTPLKKLKIDAGYEFRGGRTIPGTGTGPTGLGCVSDLHLGATYAITDALSVYVRGENLLSRRHTVLPGVESQPLHGLAGVGLKF